MTECRECRAEIFFAWDRTWSKWVPVDVALLRGDEEEYENGVLKEAHHLRHRCGFTPAPLSSGPAPHRVLYVAQDAPFEVVQASYRALARVFHPDSGSPQASSDTMRELTDAYNALSVQARRLVP